MFSMPAIYRYVLLLVIAAMLTAPMTAGWFFKPDGKISKTEFRTLSPAPKWPRRLADWKKFSATVDAYLQDRFGFREAIIAAHTWMSQKALGIGGNAEVLRGQDGWLFYRGGNMLAQSSGKLVRSETVVQTAQVFEDMQNAAKAIGARMIVALPPNAATIYSDKIPGWPDLTGKKTEIDLLLEEIKRRGISAVDLRPALKSARTEGQIYLRHDTHWNARGAIAAFNAVATAAGHPDWRLDPDKVLGPPVKIFGGDLARMLNVADAVSDLAPPLTLPAVAHKKFGSEISENAFEVLPQKPQTRTVLLIGDSFTEELFPPIFAANGVHLIWVPFGNCGFDWNWIQKQRPDEIWLMPTERFALCQREKRPAGLPSR